MRAQVLHAYGAPDSFTLEDLEALEPGPGEIRVRVASTGVNPLDVKIRSGQLAETMPMTFPLVLGSDIAGEVDRVGTGVDTFVPGDRVVGLATAGGYAEYAVLAADQTCRVPDTLALTNAATIPTAASTSRRLVGFIGPQDGETVVVNGAAGSVGSALVQALVDGGTHVVGIAGPGNHDYLRQLGARPTSYGRGVLGRVRRLACAGVDAVIDVAGHGFAETALELRGTTDRVVTIADFAAARHGVTVTTGTDEDRRAGAFEPQVIAAAQGRFRTEIAAKFPLEDLPAAHRLSAASHVRGKIVVGTP
ncbi:NADP-dependent oxidoreductase [Spelaeicoccus albus]